MKVLGNWRCVLKTRESQLERNAIFESFFAKQFSNLTKIKSFIFISLIYL